MATFVSFLAEAAQKGRTTLVDEAQPAEVPPRSEEPAPPPRDEQGLGRELFAMMRQHADEAEKGGSAMLALAGL